MNEKTSQLIEQLATKLGTTSEYLWGVLLKQAQVQVISDIVFIVIVSILIIILWKVYLYAARNGAYSEATTEMTFVYGFPTILAAIALFCMSVAALHDLFQLPTLILNPEYWALKEILNAINQ